MFGLLTVSAMFAATPLVAKLEDVDSKRGSASWERWSFSVTNTDDAARDVEICPKNVLRVAHDNAQTSKHAFALAFDDDDWSHGCVSRAMDAGETVRLKVFTRPYGTPGQGRTIVLTTSDGVPITPVA